MVSINTALPNGSRDTNDCSELPGKVMDVQECDASKTKLIA
jgi:hypothetical protein